MKKELQSFEEEFFRSIREKDAWKKVSQNEELPWNTSLISKYEDKLDWKSLCENRAIYWDVDLIEKFKFRIDWNILSENILGQRFNNAMKFDWAILKKYENLWNWHELSNSYCNIPPEIIDAYASNWDWKELIENDDIIWTYELFDKYKRYISNIDFDFLKQSRMWEQLIAIDEKVLIGKLLQENNR